MIARGSLNTIQSVEAFELAADLTEGDELASILWRKSKVLLRRCATSCSHKATFVCVSRYLLS